MTTTKARAGRSKKPVRPEALAIDVRLAEITSIDTPALVVNIFRGVKKPKGVTGAVDDALDGAITQLIKDGEIKGSAAETTLIHTFGKINPKRVLVIGLGSQDKFDAQVIRSVTAEAVRFYQPHNWRLCFHWIPLIFYEPCGKFYIPVDL